MLTYFIMNDHNNIVKFHYLKSKSFLVPSACWVVYIFIVLTVLSVGDVKYTSLSRMLIQWDGQHYFSIARDGYEMFPCLEDSSLICGTVGWFPLYPIVAATTGKLLSSFGIEERWTMIITSLLSFWLALLALFRLVETKFGLRVASLSIVALLLFPTSFYFATAFPYSIYLFLATLVFLTLEKKQYLLSAIPAGLLAVTYPSGIVIVLPLLWTLVANWHKLNMQKRLSIGTAIAAVGLTLVLFCTYYWWQFDDFFLYFHFQAKPYYRHDIAIPFVTIVKSLTALPYNNPVFIMGIFTVITTITFYQHKVPVSWQLFMFGVLLFTPTAGTMVCYYRHIIVAFPLLVMVALSVRSRRKWLLPLYAVTSIVLSWLVFLRAYKLGELM